MISKMILSFSLLFCLPILAFEKAKSPSAELSQTMSNEDQIVHRAAELLSTCVELHTTLRLLWKLPQDYKTSYSQKIAKIVYQKQSQPNTELPETIFTDPQIKKIMNQITDRTLFEPCHESISKLFSFEVDKSDINSIVGSAIFTAVQNTVKGDLAALRRSHFKSYSSN